MPNWPRRRRLKFSVSWMLMLVSRASRRDRSIVYEVDRRERWWSLAPMYAVVADARVRASCSTRRDSIRSTCPTARNRAQFDPRALARVVADQRQEARLAARIVDVAQRNHEERQVEDRERPEEDDGLARDELVARRHVDRARFHVIAAVRILAGREVRVIAVGHAVRARHEVLRAEVQFALRDALDRFAAPVLEGRAARAHVEHDLVGVENRVLRAIDEIGVPAHHDRMVAVVVRAVADDLAFHVEDVHVPDQVGGPMLVARADDLVGDRHDLVRLQDAAAASSGARSGARGRRAGLRSRSRSNSAAARATRSGSPSAGASAE
jgi:hypothetical protein